VTFEEKDAQNSKHSSKVYNGRRGKRDMGMIEYYQADEEESDRP
jgi:hypothetical protein